MSVRLVTTPWFTKNLAGGELDTRRLLGGRKGDGRAEWYRTVRAATTPNRRSTGGGPASPAAYHPRHAAGDRYRQHEPEDRAVQGGRDARHAAGRHRPAGDDRRGRAAARRPPPARRHRDVRSRRDRAGLGRAGADRGARDHRRPTRPAAPRGERRDDAARGPGRSARRGRRRPAGQRPGRGPAPRDAGDRHRSRDRHDVRLRRRPTAPTSAARSHRVSSSGSTRSRHGPPSCHGSSCAPRTGRSRATRCRRSRRARSSATRRSRPACSSGCGASWATRTRSVRPTSGRS